ILMALFALVGFATIGFIDDYAKVSKRQNLGLTAKKKIYFQILVSLVVGGSLLVLVSRGFYSTQLVIPFAKRIHPDLVIHSLLSTLHWWPLAFVPSLFFVCVVIVGSSKAVNRPNVWMGSRLAARSLPRGRSRSLPMSAAIFAGPRISIFNTSPESASSRCF